jgi:hypothetical protein
MGQNKLTLAAGGRGRFEIAENRKPRENQGADLISLFFMTISNGINQNESTPPCPCGGDTPDCKLYYTPFPAVDKKYYSPKRLGILKVLVLQGVILHNPGRKITLTHCC